MRISLFLIAAMTIALTGCQGGSSKLSTQDEAALRAASQLWVTAYNQNDWPLLATHFTPDATMMPPNSPTVSGREAIAAWEEENESGFRIALKIDEISGADDVAFIRGRSCVFIPLDDDQYGVDVGKYLEIREKQSNGDWLIKTDIFNSDSLPGAELQPSCPEDIFVPDEN